MTKILFTIMCIVMLVACQQRVTTVTNNDFLYRLVDENDENSCIYLNQKGDTVIHQNQYAYCFNDTIRHYGCVMTTDNICMAIDKNGREMYQVFWYDNGPDYLSEGLFRMLENGKIGYANEFGKVVILPQFECADSFENGRARVTKKCKLIPEGEYTRRESSEWFYINKQGQKAVKSDNQ